MKKYKLLFLGFIVILLSIINVNASDPALVGVSSSFNTIRGTTNTFEHYNYEMTQVYRQGGELYFYSNVKNNTKKVQPICLEVLLFDKDEKNIGIFNYNSLKDYETEYASKKLQAGEKLKFNYKIIDKYLADKDNNKLSDIAYFAILDDNEYCKVGGYDKYSGQKLKEIIDSRGKVTSGTKFDILIGYIDKYIPINGLNVGIGVGLVIIVVIIIVIIVIWIVYGNFLNKLHNAMYRRTTALAYVPIINSFLCVKMAFGSIVGFAYLGVNILGSLISLLGFYFVNIIASLVFIAAFIIDIIKLITGKYDLCYLDNSNNNVIVNNFNNGNNNNQGFNNAQNQTNEYGYSQDNNVKESLIGVDTNNSLEDDTLNVSMGVNNNDNMNFGNENDNQNNNNNNDNSDESDLSRFFR